MKRFGLPATILVTLGIVAIASFAQDVAGPRLSGAMQGSVRGVAVAAEPGHDKVSTRVRALVNARSQKGTSDGISVKGLGGSIAAERISVSVALSEGADPAQIMTTLAKLGAENAVTLGHHVLADVPTSRINSLADDPGVSEVDAQLMFQPFVKPSQYRGEVGMAAVRASGLEKLHARGFTGRDTKIGIIDFSFQNLRTLMSRGVLPTAASHEIRAFNACQSIEGCGDSASEEEAKHGTACAELVHRAAPGSRIYYAVAGKNAGSVAKAAAWLMDNGIDVISFSAGTHLGRHDGHDEFAHLIELAIKRGVLWISSAGNEGESHYMGRAEDTNGDGWIDIPLAGDPTNRFLTFAPKGGVISLIVNWDDWGGTVARQGDDIGLDVFLVDPKGRSMRHLTQDAKPRVAADKPARLIEATVPQGGVYRIALRANKLTRNVKFHVFSSNGGVLTPNVPDGSIAIPATSEHAVAVGAVDPATWAVKPYSSRGPTDKGLVRPDVTAIDNIPVAAFNGKTFGGTSAATAHVAGFAAVLKQMRRTASGSSVSVVQLRSDLLQATRPLAAVTPSNESGNGIVHADTLLLANADQAGATGKSVIAAAPTWLETLPRILAGGSRGGLRLAFGRTPPVYAIGSGMKVALHSPVDCDYALFSRDQAGHFELLAPHGNDPVRLNAEAPVVVPSGRETLRIQGPTGTETLVAVCAQAPAKLAEVLRTGSIPRAWSGRVFVAESRYEIRAR